MIFHYDYGDVAPAEVARFVQARELGRLVSVGADGTPHLGLYPFVHEGDRIDLHLVREDEVAADLRARPRCLFEGAGVSGTLITYDVSYRDTETPVTQAHVHLGGSGTNGGIVFFLCTNLGNGPAGTPPCPASGTVSGTIDASLIVGGAAGQGIAPGEFDEALRALRSGATYANVHTTGRPTGEIWGQVIPSRPADRGR